MAHDFAAKPRKRKTPPPPPPKKRPSLLLWLSVLFALGGLVYLLTRLADVQPDAAAERVQSPPEQPRTVSPIKRSDQETASKSRAAAPTAKSDSSTEQYDFYKLLPKSQVIPPEVDAYKSTPRSAEDTQQILLQAGSFRSPEDAERMRAQLLLQGLPNVTTSASTSSNGSTWYRVRLGPFASRSKLNKAYDKLVQMNIQPLRIKLPAS